jgi:hypothetical protein
VQGDTFGANRLQDTILSGTVPIFTHPKQYGILPNFIPWRELSEFIPLTTNDGSDSISANLLKTSLDVLMNQSAETYEGKLRLVFQYQEALDLVQSPQIAFDLYMAEFARRLGFS